MPTLKRGADIRFRAVYRQPYYRAMWRLPKGAWPNLIKVIDRDADGADTVRESRHDSVFRQAASNLVNRMVQRAAAVMTLSAWYVHGAPTIIICLI